MTATTTTISSPASSPAAAVARALAAAAFLLPWLASAALAQSTSGPAFVPGGDLELLVQGTKDPAARIFESGAEAAILVVSEKLPTPVLLHVRSHGVQAVPRDRLVEAGDGFNLRRGEPLESAGQFKVDGPEVRFGVAGVMATLRPKPPLVGEHDLGELFQHTPQYRVGADAYRPDPQILANLRQVEGDYRVRVVFGSWCSVCKSYLPRGLALDEALSSSAIAFEYFGLPLEDPWLDPEVKRLGVKSLPTAIVYRGDQEIGRFAGAEGWDRPEARLWEAVAAGR